MDQFKIDRPYTFDRVIRLIIGFIVLFLVFLLIKHLQDVLLPFLIAWLIAYLLNPLVSFFQNKLKFKSRILSISATLLIFILGITLLLIYLIPAISQEIDKLSNLIDLYLNGVNVESMLPKPWQTKFRELIILLDLPGLFKNNSFGGAIKGMSPQMGGIVNSSIHALLAVFAVFVILLYLIFILLDYDVLSDGIFNFIPEKYRHISKQIMGDLKNNMNRYFRGQAILATIVGILTAIGFSIIGLPLAIFMGLLTGLLYMIPYLHGVAIIPCIVLALLKTTETGSNPASMILGVLIIFVIVQIIMDVILVPKVMGEVTGMNPATILLSLSVWGSLMGIVGMIIALPMTTLIVSYYKRYILGVLQKEMEKEDCIESQNILIEESLEDAEL